MKSLSPGKTVHLIPRDSAVKRLCFDATSGTLRPNLVLVDRAGTVLFEINELGLKGAARDPSRKLAVVWGDSVVFGRGWSWPCLLDRLATGYQFLNGGIDADPYDKILRRAAAFNKAHEVALNVLLLGWHPIPPPPDIPLRHHGFRAKLRGFIDARQRPVGLDGEAARTARDRELRDRLTVFLEEVPNTVLATMPTALNARIAGRDLSGYLRSGDRETVFSFLGDVAYSVALQRYLFDYIGCRNEAVRQVARQTGHLLIDLATVFDTAQATDFREDFHDILHLRTRAYPKVAAAVYDGIRELL